MKFLASDPRFDVIASGSLLGIRHPEEVSFPVGYIQRIELQPLDFEELYELLEEDIAGRDRPYDDDDGPWMRSKVSYGPYEYLDLEKWDNDWKDDIFDDWDDHWDD